MFVNEVVDIEQVGPPTIGAVRLHASGGPERAIAEVLEQGGVGAQDDHIWRGQSANNRPIYDDRSD